MGITIGVLLYEGMEELDFCGPYEVFGMAVTSHEEDRVVTVSESGEPVQAFHGLRVLADHGFDDAPPLDVLVVPGGLGSRQEMNNAKLLDWLRSAAPSCQWVTSVCTGSLILYAAGLANGARITTHWGALSLLREQVGEGATVLEDVRYVRDGNLVTAAGVSAGIDMSLWVVGQLYGTERARQVQRMMQYDPAPPYQAEV